jgi:hypothetical protein
MSDLLNKFLLNEVPFWLVNPLIDKSATGCCILKKKFAVLLNQCCSKKFYQGRLSTSRQIFNGTCVIIKIVKALESQSLASAMNTRSGLICQSGMNSVCVI